MVALHALDMQESKQEQQVLRPDADRNTDSGDQTGSMKEEKCETATASNEKIDEPQQPQQPSTGKNKGKLLMYATVAPQNITFPTDLKLPSAARKKSKTVSLSAVHSKSLSFSFTRQR